MMACRKSLSHKSQEAGKYLGEQVLLAWPFLCQLVAGSHWERQDPS